MSSIKQFEIGGVTYNVKRASAEQQDEALSLLSPDLVATLAEGVKVDVPDAGYLLNYFTSLPYHAKQKFDSLIMSKISRHGEEVFVCAKDFDGRLVEWQELRAKVTLWNFEPFFARWASEIKSARDQALKEAKKPKAL